MNDRNKEGRVIRYQVLDDGNVDMRFISQAVQAALECHRVGSQKAVAASPDEIAAGQGIIECAMQAFSLECALKGLHQALGRRFCKIHDLLRLLDNLPSDVQEQIEANWKLWTLVPATQKKTFRELVEQHKDDFLAWRYQKASKLESDYFGLYEAIHAVNSVTRSMESSQDKSA